MTILCYIKYEHENNIFEDLLFTTSLVHTIAECVFNNLNEFIAYQDIDWLESIEISTDGAYAMSCKHTELVA